MRHQSTDPHEKQMHDRFHACFGKNPTALLAIMFCLTGWLASSARQAHGLQAEHGTVRGTVHDGTGRLVSGASVYVEEKGASSTPRTQSGESGEFALEVSCHSECFLVAEKADMHSAPVVAHISPDEHAIPMDLILDRVGTLPRTKSANASGMQEVEFADAPAFTIAGVTDWTAVGGHGSDSTLRTSEDLARQALSLKPDQESVSSRPRSSDRKLDAEEGPLLSAVSAQPKSYLANHRLGAYYLGAGQAQESLRCFEKAYALDPSQRDNEYDLALALRQTGDLKGARGHVDALLRQAETADALRLEAEIDEAQGDPLRAVREFEHAAKLDQSEQSYFEWGSELLLHRAIWQAINVLNMGIKAYPKSRQMLTAMGSALFAGARYNEAAQRICEASDLDAAAAGPYLILAKIDLASPNPLPCADSKLEDFANRNPENAQAQYVYAMHILKLHATAPSEAATRKAEALLLKSTQIDPQYGEALLEEGKLCFSRNELDHAITYFSKSIQADPNLAEAHYRIAVALNRNGEYAKAQQEFQLHSEIKRRQMEQAESERRAVKQFIVADGEADSRSAH